MKYGHNSDPDRREVLQMTTAFVLQLFAAQAAQASQTTTPIVYGPLEADPTGLLDLAPGFSYVVVRERDEVLSDGQRAPCQPDGMTCLTDVDGRWVLLRNHELGDREFIERWNEGPLPFSEGKVPHPCLNDTLYGGVSRLVLDPATLRSDLKERPFGTSNAVTSSNMVLAGTDLNCGGGVVWVDGKPGWVSCEESSRPGHGYPFLTLPDDHTLTEPRLIRSWGRFHREAVAQDRDTGIIYMTEDRYDACFYRFIPDDPAHPTGSGRVQAMVLEGVKNTHPYSGSETQAPKWPNGTTWPVRWVDVDDPQATEKTCRAQSHEKGATKFHRTEGISVRPGEVWFVASTAGGCGGGQLFRYRPGSFPADGGTITLELEVEDRTRLSAPDNIVIAPWGDLLMAEDNYASGGGATHQHIRGFRADGSVYQLARNRQNVVPNKGAPGAEFAGLCFSPDGQILFANIQQPLHMTIAITGPWTGSRY